jgi:hypothetical protein
MRPRRFLAAALVIAAASVTALAAGSSLASSAATTEFKGRFVCGDRPLAEARIELLGAPRSSGSSGGGGIWGWIAPLDSHPSYTVRGTTYAGSQGEWSFKVPRTKSVNYYLRAVLDDGRGTVVTDYPSTDPVAATPGSGGTNFDDVAVQDYHTQSYPGHECKLWLALKDANASYAQLTGKRPPYGDVVAEYDAPNRGTPYAAYTTIVWPRDYPVADGAGVRHEFWHTIRNASLGSEEAFLDEVSQHDFRVRGSVCARTTPQYAFHEGWAEFWAHDLWPTPACSGIRADDPAVEGNVAWALTRLARNCAAASPRRMVEVMLARGRSIHSLADFEKELRIDATACEGRPLDPHSVPRVKASPPVSDELWVHDLRAALTSVRQRATNLSALLPGADRAAVKARCAVTPCLEAIARKLAPALIRGQLAQARAAAATFQNALSIDAQGELRGHPTKTFVDRIRTTPRSLAQRLATIGIDSVTEALTDARPLATRDHSPGSRLVLGVIRSQRAALVHARQRGTGLVIGPLGWFEWFGDPKKRRTTTTPTVYRFEASFDGLREGTITNQTARDGVVFGSARALGFPGKLPLYVCDTGPRAFLDWAETYACGLGGTPFHYTGTLARLSFPARSVFVLVGATSAVPGGIPVELDGFDAAGTLVLQTARLVGVSSLGDRAGLTGRLSLTPPITAHAIRFIALYVNSAIATVPITPTPVPWLEEPRIMFDELVYRQKPAP